MFGKKQIIHLLTVVSCSSILVLMLLLNSGLIDEVDASDNQKVLLADLPDINLTVPQTLQLSDKIFNYSKSFVQESKGNLTKLNMLLLDDLVKRGLLNEDEKGKLMSVLHQVSQNGTLANIPVINKDITTMIEGSNVNNSNVNFNVLANIIKKKLNDFTIIDGIEGLGPVTIDLDIHISSRTEVITGCTLYGAAAYGAIGAIVAGNVCNAIL